jgi:hypothetical protein
MAFRSYIGFRPKISRRTDPTPKRPERETKSKWDIIFGFSGLLTILATLLIALISYKQNVQIQSLQSRTAEEVQGMKGQSDLAVQESAGKTSLTVTELNTALNGQLARLVDERERTLNERDNQIKKYINDENVRLGRFSKESDVDLKLVEVATEILKSESTQSNQSLRAWAVDIVNSHSTVQMGKAATAEAIAGPIVGEPVSVAVLSRYGNGNPTDGCSVKYSRPGSPTAFRFPRLTDGGVSEAQLSKGAYDFWVDCGDSHSDIQQFYVQDALKIEFMVLTSQPKPK